MQEQLPSSKNLSSIVDRIRPSVQGLLASASGNDPGTLVQRAVRANVRDSVKHLRHGSEILERMIHREGLVVVGAEYSQETGRVGFFDGVPGSA